MSQPLYPQFQWLHSSNESKNLLRNHNKQDKELGYTIKFYTKSHVRYVNIMNNGLNDSLSRGNFFIYNFNQHSPSCTALAIGKTHTDDNTI